MTFQTMTPPPPTISYTQKNRVFYWCLFSIVEVSKGKFTYFKPRHTQIGRLSTNFILINITHQNPEVPNPHYLQYPLVCHIHFRIFPNICQRLAGECSQVWDILHHEKKYWFHMHRKVLLHHRFSVKRRPQRSIHRHPLHMEYTLCQIVTFLSVLIWR